jgi:hypothetical protein
VLTTSGSPLVSGMSPDDAMATTPIKTTRVKVLRPFLLKTKRQEADAVIEIDHRLAAELSGLNKVEILKPEAAAVVEDPKPVVRKTKKED